MLPKGLGPRDHITPTLQQLHLLPIHARITFKISLLMYHVQSGTSPWYMASMVKSQELQIWLNIKLELKKFDLELLSMKRKEEVETAKIKLDSGEYSVGIYKPQVISSKNLQIQCNWLRFGQFKIVEIQS